MILQFLFKPLRDDSQLSVFEARMDARFNEMMATQLSAFEARMDARFNEMMATVLMLAVFVLVLAAVMLAAVMLLLWKMDKMDARLGKVEKNQTWMMLASPERVDFWNERTVNDPAPTPRPWNLAIDAAKYYDDGGNKAGGNLKLRCALTGELSEAKASKQQKVVVAHLLRRNNPDFAFAQFGLDAENDRDGMRNVMLLCRGLKEAFDTKRISFYQAADGKYRMKVWDERVRRKQIYEGEQGDTKTIGDCENEQLCLEFPDKKTPYTRILSYHHRVCFYNAKMRNWIGENEVVPDVYGTPYKGTVPGEIEINTELEINSELDSHLSDQLSPNKISGELALTATASSLTGDATATTPPHSF